MGLFSNNKKLCPICGNPTPRLMATKVDDMPICKECANKIYLPNGMLENMNIEAFRQYMNFYDENKQLREVFFETYHYNFGLFGDDLVLDSAHGLLRMKNNKEALVFEAASLKNFRILEGDKVLYESRKQGLLCHKSDVPERVKGMSALIDQFNLQRREYEWMERREKEREERARERGENVVHRYTPRPTFTVPELFQHYHIELSFDHPYWTEVRWEVVAPSFDSNYPSIESYLVDYENSTEKMRALAVNLMQLMNPAAQEIAAGSSLAEPQTTQVIDTVEEIKKYKQLLDMGIITEEEFSAKKRQLLGI